ncbi:hypothetical protein M5K25_019524 [Dendrobium thyrsiflorum]|uniref:Uncharacterized protein n=1 Tax=Dendrobium thyrsiflorum TaxID=117978 RepID=A0ABD0UF56_DENTH
MDIDTVELNVSERRTQRHQIRLNLSPNEPKSKTRSTFGRFKPQFGLPNSFQTGRAYSRIERLDEKNPTIPRSLESDILMIIKCLINPVHSNHSTNTPNLSLIYWLCHSQKTINRPLISHKRGPRSKKRRREEKNEETPPPPPESAGPPPDAVILPDHHPTLEFRRTTT